jgi:hypothetical protein
MDQQQQPDHDPNDPDISWLVELINNGLQRQEQQRKQQEQQRKQKQEQQ